MLIMQVYQALAPLAYDMFSEGPSSERTRLFRAFYTIFTRCHFPFRPDSIELSLQRDVAVAEVTISGPGRFLLPGLVSLRRQHMQPVEPFHQLTVPPSYIGGRVTITSEDTRVLTIPMLPELDHFVDPLLDVYRRDLRSYLVTSKKAWDIEEERQALNDLRHLLSSRREKRGGN